MTAKKRTRPRRHHVTTSCQVTANIALRVDGEPLALELTVPGGTATAQQLLPALRILTDQLVDAAIHKVEAAGQKVSCQKGCGACCRQLVPIAPAEAHRLQTVVDALPEERRAEVVVRFAEARSRLQAADQLDTLLDPSPMTLEQRRRFGLDYFRLGIACPFLLDESCSIYHERPLACREYLVTSPVAHCAQPSASTIDCVPMPVKVSVALQRLESAQDTASASWVPLIIAPEWAQMHPAAPPTSSGPAQLESVFELLGATQSVT